MRSSYEVKGPNFLLNVGEDYKHALEVATKMAQEHNTDVIVYFRETPEEGFTCFDKVLTMHPHPPSHLHVLS